tara:strand:- start:2052 stop:2420 length:369 start_codon:yes stop_codon:yes gene_type:complete
MASFGVALPLRRSSSDGFVMVKSIGPLIRQNLKMLILTNPGERIMEPDFGVGIRNFLFQNFHSGTIAEIDNAIREQVKQFLPVITIIGIAFDQSMIDSNRLGIAIKYTIPNIGTADLLQITI